MTGRIAGGFFLRVDDRRQRRRWSLLRHEIINTIVRSNLIVRHTGPLAAITWSADSWSELSSLGDVGHAVGLEKVEVGTGVNGIQGRARSHVSCLVGAHILTNGHVIGLVTGAAA
jgi:hypothetical protein